MPKFRYIGPRTLDGTSVQLLAPNRKFVLTTMSVGGKAQEYALRKVAKRDAHTLEGVQAKNVGEETLTGEVRKRETMINVRATDRVMLTYFRLAHSIEGLPMFEEIL